MGLFRRSQPKEPTAAQVSTVDLSGWAAARDLEFAGNKNQVGYLRAFTWSADTQINVCRGLLPGIEFGVVLHQLELVDAESLGVFGLRTESHQADLSLIDFIPGLEWFSTSDKTRYGRLPRTAVAVRVPEATGTLCGLRVGLEMEGFPAGGDSVWEPRDLAPSGSPGWTALIRKYADLAAAEEVLRGPVREALAARPANRFRIEFLFGQLVVSHEGHATDAALDAVCALTAKLAAGIREVCARFAKQAEGFAEPLGEPHWLPGVEAEPTDRHILQPQGMWMDLPVAYARKRGMAVEDGLLFHRAHPHAPAPGEAVCVLRGDGIRLVVAIEREAVDVSWLEELVADPGGPIGTNWAVLPVPGRPDTPPSFFGGEPVEGGGRYAVRDEVLYAWKLRDRWQVDEAPLDELAAWARALPG